MCWDIIGKEHLFQIYDLEADGEVVEEGGDGGALSLASNCPVDPVHHHGSGGRGNRGVTSVCLVWSGQV